MNTREQAWCLLTVFVAMLKQADINFVDSYKSK
jgi:hypothetical protein